MPTWTNLLHPHEVIWGRDAQRKSAMRKCLNWIQVNVRWSKKKKDNGFTIAEINSSFLAFKRGLHSILNLTRYQCNKLHENQMNTELKIRYIDRQIEREREREREAQRARGTESERHREREAQRARERKIKERERGKETKGDKDKGERERQRDKRREKETERERQT